MSDSAIPTKKPFNIAIVGGGLGGVILAIGLSEHGVPVKIYESAKSFGEIGAGIAFGPNAMRALGLISPDLLEAFHRHATYNGSPEREATAFSFRLAEDSRNGNGKKAGDLLFHLESEKDANSWTNTKPRCCVHRAKFLDEIIKLVPKDVACFNKSLNSLEDISDPKGGGVRLHFADGSSAFADAVIGCDGIKSKTRECILGQKVTPSYAGQYAYRAMVPLEVFKTSLGYELAVNGHIYVGYNRYVITYPVDNGKVVNMVLLCKDSNPNWTHDTWLKPTTMEGLREETEGLHPRLADLLARFSNRDKWALFDISHPERYCKSRVCLLGDSAHASTPHMGGGAGQAIEDAYVMSNLLGRVARPEDLSKAFEAFDAVRRPRSQQLVKNSRANGLAFELREDGVGDDATKLLESIEARWRWLWDEDLEQHLQQAVTRLG